jgi:thioredoxin-related protein
MNTQGFYKYQDEQIYYAPNYVEGQEYTLISEYKDDNEYPVDEWYWFDCEEDALLFFKL